MVAKIHLRSDKVCQITLGIMNLCGYIGLRKIYQKIKYADANITTTTLNESEKCCAATFFYAIRRSLHNVFPIHSKWSCRSFHPQL